MFLRRHTEHHNFVVPAGSDQASNAIDTGFHVYGGMELPNLGAGTSVKFQVSMDGSSWYDAVSDRNEAIAAIDSTAAKFAIIPFECFAANFMRLAVTGTTASEFTLPAKFYS